MVGAAALLIVGIACLPAVDPAVFFGAVAVRSEQYGVGGVMINSDVVVHAVRIPIADSVALLGGLNSLDHIGGGQSNAGDAVLFNTCSVGGLEFEVSVEAPAGDGTGQEVGVAGNDNGRLSYRRLSYRRLSNRRLGYRRLSYRRLSYRRLSNGRSGLAVKYCAGLESIIADLLALHDLVGHVVVLSDGSHGDDVGLDLGAAVGNNLILGLDKDGILGIEREGLPILSSSVVSLNDVALNIRGQTAKVREYFVFVVNVAEQLNDSVAVVEGLPEVDGVNFLAFGNLEIRDNGELVADLELTGLGGAGPVFYGNDSLVAYRRSLSSFSRLSCRTVRAFDSNLGLGGNFGLDFAEVDQLVFAGAEVVDLVDDLALAVGDNLEVNLDEDLLRGEVITLGSLRSIVLETVAGDVGFGTAAAVGQDNFCVSSAFIQEIISDSQLGLVEVQNAFEVGQLARHRGADTGEVHVELIVNGIADMSVIGNAVNLDRGLAAGLRSLGVGLGSLGVGLGSFSLDGLGLFGLDGLGLFGSDRLFLLIDIVVTLLVSFGRGAVGSAVLEEVDVYGLRTFGTGCEYDIVAAGDRSGEGAVAVVGHRITRPCCAGAACRPAVSVNSTPTEGVFKVYCDGADGTGIDRTGIGTGIGIVTYEFEVAVAAVSGPLGVAVRVEVDVVCTICINCPVITHAVREPAGVAIPVILLYFKSIAG